MKEKRYYCNWALSSSIKNDKLPIIKVLTISFVIATAITILIYYNIMMSMYGENLESYSESTYKYLDDIADNVIGEAGINLAEIPDIVEYDITYKGGEIIFNYSIDNNKEKEFATSASMTVTLSKDFKILSKKPNFSSKEAYVIKHEKLFYSIIFAYGFLTWILIGIVAIAIISNTKKMNMKDNS